MRLFSRLTVVYFFLLLIMGCNSNLSPTFKTGDRVAVKQNQIGVIVENWSGYPFGNKYSYRVIVNNTSSWYSEENLEIVDPMPGNLEEASWHNENKMKQKTQNPPKDN